MLQNDINSHKYHKTEKNNCPCDFEELESHMKPPYSNVIILRNPCSIIAGIYLRNCFYMGMLNFFFLFLLEL